MLKITVSLCVFNPKIFLIMSFETSQIVYKTMPQLREIFRLEFPEIVEAAMNSPNNKVFKSVSLKILHELFPDKKRELEQIRHLYDYDGQTVFELSNRSHVKIDTVAYLYDFLKHGPNDSIDKDLIIDLYYQFKRVYSTIAFGYDKNRAFSWMNRWPSGLDEDIRSQRYKNKDRIIHLLIGKILMKDEDAGRYCLDSTSSCEENYRQVSRWWNDHRFQLHFAARTPEEVKAYLGNSVSEETFRLMKCAQEKGMPFFLTPYYASLLNTEPLGFDDSTLRSSVLYSPELVNAFGRIRSWETAESVDAGKPNGAGWIVPDVFNVHRRYPEVAMLISDTMGRACGGLCSYCQRMYEFQNQGLNFDLEALRPKVGWNKKLKALMGYFEEDSQIRDILLSGGDFLMSRNSSLRHVLEEVLEMAKRKRTRNQSRAEGEKYAEIQRVRIGTRMPVYLPMRFDDELIDILADFKRRGSELGIQQFVIQTHFQTPLEMTDEARRAVDRILSTGWLITNQHVFNVAASRRGHNAKLRRVLNQQGIVCYYTFSVKGYEEVHGLFAPIARSVQEAEEEKGLGRLEDHQVWELTSMIRSASNRGVPIKKALEHYDVPFFSSDRNVLNLPAIGKSFTFSLVGIDARGRRVLRFEHDRQRLHSPVVDRLGAVFIIENKSVAEYLRQLSEMGEDMGDYASVWEYTRAETEPRFPLYAYPKFPFRRTQRMTNLCLTAGKTTQHPPW